MLSPIITSVGGPSEKLEHTAISIACRYFIEKIEVSFALVMERFQFYSWEAIQLLRILEVFIEQDNSLCSGI